MKVGIVRESFPGEKRVALIPEGVSILSKMGLEVIVETGAGVEAGHIDDAYIAKGASILPNRSEVFKNADFILQVRALGANQASGSKEAGEYRSGQVVIASIEPLSAAASIADAARTGATIFALELIPRITRGQAMDVLSSMATVAGYKAVLMAASHCARMFPMFMTAAGTITPARVFIIGAGVAGLQAIATAKRLGAVVKAYDVRPAVKEQVESLGAKFVEMELETAEGSGGYAREMNEEFYRKQRELMGNVVADSDVVITTAAIPGKKSPVLVTADMVARMQAGSVIVDLAAERGGNCELTKADETVTAHNVTILGPTNLPSTAPYHASQMYSKNLTNFIKLIVDKSGALKIDTTDEVVRDTLVAQGGEVVNQRIKDLLGAGSSSPKN
jgi:NAD(P) transhydrogenase subunit alpha